MPSIPGEKIASNVMEKLRAERAAALNAVAEISAAIAKADADLKKASTQAEKTRKELSSESDE